MPIPIIRCWCVPVGGLFLQLQPGQTRCDWPRCLNGERPDPEADRPSEASAT